MPLSRTTYDYFHTSADINITTGGEHMGVVDDLVQYTRRSYERGLTIGVSGNTSARVDTDRMWIKQSGVCLGEVQSDDFLLVDFAGNVLVGEGLPSKEWKFHAGTYRLRPDVGAVFHLHPPYTTAFAVAGVLPPIVTGAGRGKVRRWEMVEGAPSGSEELGRQVSEAFALHEDVHAVLIKGHGTVCVGKDVREAYYMSEYMEDAARAAYLIKSMGGEYQ